MNSVNSLIQQQSIANRVKIGKADSSLVQGNQKTAAVANQNAQVEQFPAWLNPPVPSANDEVFSHQHNVALSAFKNYQIDESDQRLTFANTDSTYKPADEYEKIKEAGNQALKDTIEAFKSKTAQIERPSETSGNVSPIQQDNFNLDMSMGNTGINLSNNAPVYTTASNALNSAIAQGYQPSSTLSDSSLPPAAAGAINNLYATEVQARINSDKSGFDVTKTIAHPKPESKPEPIAEPKSSPQVAPTVVATLEPVATKYVDPEPVTNQTIQEIGEMVGPGDPIYAGVDEQEEDSKSTSENKTGVTAKKANGEDLSEEELAEVEDLKARDDEVRTHENAHKSAGGQYAGSPSYTYTTGPDGKRYVTDGEVSIDIGEEADPQDTIDKMQQVKRAAMAPAEPSSQDRVVYNEATQLESQARQELNELKAQEQEIANAERQKAVQAPESTETEQTQEKPIVQEQDIKPSPAATQAAEPRTASVTNTANTTNDSNTVNNAQPQVKQPSIEEQIANKRSAEPATQKQPEVKTADKAEEVKDEPKLDNTPPKISAGGTTRSLSSNNEENVGPDV